MEGWLSDIWAAAKTAGPFGILIITFLWYSEREERRKLLDEIRQIQNDKDTLLERVIKGLGDSSSAIQTTGESMNSVRSAMTALERMFLAIMRKPGE